MSILAENVEAVLVTKGDVDLDKILRSLCHFRKTTVWDNSQGPNMGPLGQFLAACYVSEELCDVVYFQDDDCLTHPRLILDAWEPGAIVCNMGTAGHGAGYLDKPDKLMGFGSCFERKLIKLTFERYWEKFPIDRVTWREPGRIFTAINRKIVRVVNVEAVSLPWAYGPDRLGAQPEHNAMANEARRRALEVEP